MAAAPAFTGENDKAKTFRVALGSEGPLDERNGEKIAYTEKVMGGISVEEQRGDALWRGWKGTEGKAEEEDEEEKAIKMRERANKNEENGDRDICRNLMNVSLR